MDTRAAIVLAPLLLSACGLGGGGNPGSEDPSADGTLWDRLRAGAQTVELAPELSRIDVTARMGDQHVRTHLVVLHGQTSLRAEADGTLVLSDLAVAVDDVILHHDLLPEEGLHLMNIVARLEAELPARTIWIDDDELEAEASGDLVIDWAVMNAEGQAAPLAPQPVRKVPFAIAAERDERAEVEITLAGRLAGTFWSFADYVELSDLDFSLTSGIPEASGIVP